MNHPIYGVIGRCPVSYRYVCLSENLLPRLSFLGLREPFGAMMIMAFMTFVATVFSAVGIKLFRNLDQIYILLAGLIIGFTMFLAGFLTSYSFPSTLRDYNLITQLYRRNGIKQVLDQKGPKAHAALICSIASGLPAGAVELSSESLSSALRTLGYAADDILPLMQRANLR